jgi:hypothetical protein
LSGKAELAALNRYDATKVVVHIPGEEQEHGAETIIAVFLFHRNLCSELDGVGQE